jgi:tellurite methyltransferase
MKKKPVPFYETEYRDTQGPSVFGEVSEEIRQLLPKLPPQSVVLDLGCGDGRNTLFLLEQGMAVTAIDVSQNAIAKLESRASGCGNRLKTDVMDVRDFVSKHLFDLIIAHGVLHLLPRQDWTQLIVRMKEMTKPAGFNVAAVFTDLLPPPEDLKPFMPGLFRERELLDYYEDWHVELFSSYVKEDEHAGGLRHRHPINKIVARKLA